MKSEFTHKQASVTGPNKQAGMTGAGWLVTILVVGSIATLAGKLVPLYVDHNIMSNVLDGMATESGFTLKTDPDIQKIITQRFAVNSVRKFDVRNNIKINRTSRGVDLVMAYEVRMPIIRNIDLIATFDKSVQLRN